MRYLSERRTWGLWDRLEREAVEYYGTLHDAKNALRGIGPLKLHFTMEHWERKLSDLHCQHMRLKRRFKVMAIIGQRLVVPKTGRYLSELVEDCSNQVIGFDVIQAELQKETHNVRSR